MKETLYFVPAVVSRRQVITSLGNYQRTGSFLSGVTMWVCPQWSDLFQMKTEMFHHSVSIDQFRGQVPLLCSALQTFYIIVHCLLCKFLFTILMHSTTIMAEDSKNHIKHTKNTHNYTQKHKTKRKITQKCIQYNKTIKTKKKTYRWNKAAPYGIFSLTYHTSWHKDKTLRNMIFVFMFPLFSRIWQRIAMNTLSPLHSQYTSSSLVHFQLFYVFYHFIIHFYCSFCPRCVLSSF